MELNEIDWVYAALLNARHENMSVSDLIEACEHSKTCREFDVAVNLLAQTTGLHNEDLPTEDF